jgi:DNA polymerase/3'-5' exonuclease PolX
MGSYRRGKETLGDVDVHITHKDFKEKVPADALGKIIDALWNRDHIAFHLTFLYGMQTGLSDSDYQKRTTNIPKDAWRTTKSMGPPKHLKAEKSSSSYMGVFNSPLVRGKRRRVDIKIYPYRERIFAALYFTGNGFFNRSMRLWARSFGWQLNDHGLFVRDTPQRVMEAEDEKVVFEKLQLVYKKAQERDAFDALEPIDGYFDEPPPNKTDDEMKESHVWIK